MTAVPKALQVVDVVGLDNVPARGRRGRDAEGVAGGGVAGAGRSRALVRARKPRQEPRLRPLRRSTEPDVLRRRGGDSGDDCGGAGDEGPGRHLRREGRDGLLLLLVGRPDRVERGRLRARAALPAVASRSLGLALALPPLGAARVHSGLAGAGLRPLGAGRRRPGRADGVRTSRVGDAGEEDGREHPPQGRRRAGAAGAALDRFQDRRPAGRAPSGARRRGRSGRRLRRCARRGSTPAREARRQRRVAALGEGRSRTTKAPSPSPSAPRRPRHTGSRRMGSRGLRSPSPFRRDSRSDREGGGPPRGGGARPRRGHAGRAARFAVGVAPAADRAAVAQRLRARGATRDRRPRPDPRARGLGARAAALRGVAERGTSRRSAPRRVAYEPERPFLPRQWYAAQNRAFDAWAEPPPFAAGAGRRDRLGHRRRRIPSCRADRGREELRRRVRPPSTRRGTARSSPG